MSGGDKDAAAASRPHRTDTRRNRSDERRPRRPAERHSDASFLIQNRENRLIFETSSDIIRSS
jgi:hypothetical protein